ncbi:MAG TPA: hypothetical protein VJU60_06980 [Thermoleophilaceae bacterium]|nr:hypothetical protein [Thermoleophilaceae bacterium]
MGLIAFLIWLAVTGLVIGAFARLALPGPDPMGIGQTILVGLAGSFIGGIITSLLAGRNAWSFLVAVAVSTGIVYMIRRSRGGSLFNPGSYQGRPLGRPRRRF